MTPVEVLKIVQERLNAAAMPKLGHIVVEVTIAALMKEFMAEEAMSKETDEPSKTTNKNNGGKSYPTLDKDEKQKNA